MSGWASGAEYVAAQTGAFSAEAPGSVSGGIPLPPAPPSPPAGAGDFGGPDDFGEWPGLETAIQSLLDRRIMTPEEYYELSAEAKRQAFTISGDISTATIERIHQLLSDNYGDIANREAFLREANSVLGSLPISESHLEHVYRNAANQGYTQGQDHVLDHPLVADAFPYRAYYAIHDSPRVRPTHLAMERHGLNGTNVYFKDDPTWRRFKPPWDWNCRCGWAPLSVRDAARLGVEEAKEWLKTGIEPLHIQVTPPPFAPSPSWDILAV